MESGIYLILNKCDNKKYVGQSLNIKRRISRHKSELRYNKHHNKYLQREFNKYGEENFEFNILEVCLIEKLDDREKYWINKLDTLDYKKGFNLEGGGNANKIISEVTRNKKIGKNNPMYGKRLSSEHKELIRLSNLGSSDKLTEMQVEEIKILLLKNMPIKELSVKYNVDITTIDKIAKIKNWKWVREDLNNDILKIFTNKKALKNKRDKTIKALFDIGYTLKEIEEKTGVSKTVLQRVLGENSKTILEKRNYEIVCDFEKGMPKKEIMDKYNISSCVYVSVTKEAYNKKVDEIKNQAIELRKKGLSVNEISQKLNKHRTTITEWTKHLIKKI